MNKKVMRAKIFAMVWPAAIEGVLQMTVGFVATAMVGHIGVTAIGAVGLTNRITQMVWAMYNAVTTGATILVAQRYGAKDIEGVKKTAMQALVIGITAIIILCGIIIFAGRYFLIGLGARGQLLSDAVIYLNTIVYSLPFMVIVLISGSVMRGMGNARTPMNIALIINSVNIAAGYIFIFGPFGLPAFGIKGAAMAAIIAQGVGTMLDFYVLFGDNGIMNGYVSMENLKLRIKETYEILHIGIPTAMESVFWQIAHTVLTIIVIGFGDVALAAHQLGIQAESISYMPAQGFGIASTALVGQSIGAGDEKAAGEYVREISLWTGIVTIFCAAMLFIYPQIFMTILTDEKEVIDLGCIYLRLMALAQLPQNLSGVINGALRGSGDTKAPMIVAGTGLWAVRVPLAFLLTRFLGMDVVGVWISMTLDLFVRFALSLIRYSRRGLKASITGNEA